MDMRARQRMLHTFNAWPSILRLCGVLQRECDAKGTNNYIGSKRDGQ